MKWIRLSILDLLIATAAIAILVVLNLRPTDVGSGIAIDAIGWPLNFHATTIADILETTTGERTRNVKTTLFFDWQNLIINAVVAVLLALIATLLFRWIRMTKIYPKRQGAG